MANNSDDDDKTRRLDDDYFRDIARKAKGQNFDGDKTQLVTKKGDSGLQKETKNPVSEDGDRTRVYRPNEPVVSKASGQTKSPMEDPPVGWLIAIDGPGKGTVLTLGIGMNSIGRGDDPRVSIPFDDQQISRGKSFAVAYDEKNAQFHLLPGDGKTLVYIDGSPVLSGVLMESHMRLQIGQTTFTFVPLCGPDFNWAE